MPAIEDFVKQTAEAAGEDSDDSRDGGVGDLTDDDNDRDDEEGAGSRAWATGVRSGGSGDGGYSSSSSARRGGDKRSRPPSPGAEGYRSSSSPGRTRRRRRRRTEPRPPSYNEILLADKSFHNPHASETMADAFGILRPASFVLDVGDDDRSLGGAVNTPAAVATSAAPVAGLVAATSEEGGDVDRGGGGGGGDESKGSGLGEDRSWFYDTVRDRQNRLWADTRVRKGVELARKGQHQVSF